MTQEQFQFIDKCNTQQLVNCYMESKEMLCSFQAGLLQNAIKIYDINVIGWTKETKKELSELCDFNKELNFKIINLLEQMKFINSTYYQKTGIHINY